MVGASFTQHEQELIVQNVPLFFFWNLNSSRFSEAQEWRSVFNGRELRVKKNTPIMFVFLLAMQHFAWLIPIMGF